MKKFENPDILNSVAKFQRTFNAPVLNVPTIPKGRVDLRIELIKEELQELESAIANDDLVEVADALCDLQYVLTGAILEFGMGAIFKDLFEEVQRSNMSKACEGYNNAVKTMDYYAEKGIETYSEKLEGDTYIVLRRSDDKTLKNVNYSPANLKPILDGI